MNKILRLFRIRELNQNPRSLTSLSCQTENRIEVWECRKPLFPYQKMTFSNRCILTIRTFTLGIFVNIVIMSLAVEMWSKTIILLHKSGNNSISRTILANVRGIPRIKLQLNVIKLSINVGSPYRSQVYLSADCSIFNRYGLTCGHYYNLPVIADFLNCNYRFKCITNLYNDQTFSLPSGI